VDSLRLWKGWVFRGITGRKYRAMKRALIVAATACFRAVGGAPTQLHRGPGGIKYG
jgi:hypothetical protein